VRQKRSSRGLGWAPPQRAAPLLAFSMVLFMLNKERSWSQKNSLKVPSPSPFCTVHPVVLPVRETPLILFVFNQSNNYSIQFIMLRGQRNWNIFLDVCLLYQFAPEEQLVSCFFAYLKNNNWGTDMSCKSIPLTWVCLCVCRLITDLFMCILDWLQICLWLGFNVSIRYRSTIDSSRCK
jgi:hypothetical protein